MPCSIAQCGTSAPSPVCVCAHACLDLHAGLRQWAWVQLFNRQRQGLLGVSAPGTCMQTLTDADADTGRSTRGNTPLRSKQTGIAGEIE